MALNELLRFLRAQPWAVEATVNAQGQPEAAVIGVAVTETLELAFDTLPGSRKAANLRGNPHTTLVMGRGDGQTAQIGGLVDERAGDELQQLKAAYLQRVPDGPVRAVAKPIAASRWPTTALRPKPAG